ncbi:hypothetical protein [Demequina sp. SO4-13]|uniref:hypothetical protein n=1 Tax=Demequina sp. SO4-13 TaxID=3401027 RepID=UPI003AF76011
MDDCPAEVDAVVSLCRVGDEQVPPGTTRTNRLEVWLVHSEAEHEDTHLQDVLEQVADAVAELLARGNTVLLHGVLGRPML